MRAALIVAGNELRRRLRDRSAWVMAVVAPLALATIITAAIGSGDDIDVDLLVVDADQSELSGAFVQGLLESEEAAAGGVTFYRARDVSAARRGVRDDVAGAALVIPAGFADSLTGDTPLAVEVLRHPESPVAGAVARAVAEGFAARVDAGRLAVRTVLARAGETGVAFEGDQLAAIAQEVGMAEPAVATEERGLDDRLQLVAYFAPAMGLVFLFFTVGFGARSILSERQEGTLTRLRSAPISGISLLAGKAIAAFVLGLFSLLSLWFTTAVIFGADWGDPLAVVVLCAAVVLAVAGITAVLATYATNEEQIASSTAMLTFLLALLGGNFVTPGAMPDLLRRISLLTPNGWALRGFTDLSAQGGGLGDVAVAVLVLLGLFAVTAAFAAVRAPKLLST